MERWYIIHGPRKKPLDFGGNLLSRYVRVKVRAGLSFRLGGGRTKHNTRRHWVYRWGPAESNPATLGKGKGIKVHTLDKAPLRSESPSQKRSDMACVLKGFHSFTCTPTRSSAIGMSHTCLCVPSHSWYSFTDPGGMKAKWTLVRSSPGRDSNPQPPDCKSGTLPHSHYPAFVSR